MFKAEEVSVLFKYKNSADLHFSKLGDKVKFYVKAENATEAEELKSNEQVVVSDNKVLFKDLSTYKIDRLDLN